MTSHRPNGRPRMSNGRFYALLAFALIALTMILAVIDQSVNGCS